MYLYAIRAKRTPYAKIGISTDPDRRITDMQTDCPHVLHFVACVECERAYDVEQWLHARLGFVRAQGEWFWIPLDTLVILAVRQAFRVLELGRLPAAPSRLAQWKARRPQLVVTPTTQPATPLPVRIVPLDMCQLLRDHDANLGEAHVHMRALGWTIDESIWNQAIPDPIKVAEAHKRAARFRRRVQP